MVEGPVLRLVCAWLCGSQRQWFSGNCEALTRSLCLCEPMGKLAFPHLFSGSLWLMRRGQINLKVFSDYALQKATNKGVFSF